MIRHIFPVKRSSDFGIARIVMKRVITFGTFDLLHPGHEYYLHQARSYGDFVITIVARDETVEKLKNKKPSHTQEQRVQALIDSGLCDQVFLGKPDHYYDRLLELQPDVICLWYDQHHLVPGLEKFLQTHKLDIKIIRIPAFEPHIHKTSLLR